MKPRGGLPSIDFAEKSATTIIANAVATIEKIINTTLAPADPRRLHIQALCTEIIQQRQIIDFAAKQNLLSYADGEYLDHLGAYLSVDRLPSQSALTTMEFILSTEQSNTYIVPAGSQISAGTALFKTNELLQIPVGKLRGEVVASALVSGTSANGFLPGQINTLVSTLPFIDSVQNLTESAGGADEEDDENFAERIRLAPDSFSVAGPEAAYVFWTRTANQNIKSVSVESPTPGVVEIRPLLSNGELPSDEMLEAVSDVLSALSVRPLTDYVKVLKPTQVAYSIDVEYWISSSDKSKAGVINEKVKEATADYVLWQRSEQGRDINPDQLTVVLKAAGVKRVNIKSPKFTKIARTEVAHESSVSVNYVGDEDD